MENARASFRDLLRRWGMFPTKNLMNLIEKAVNQRWNSTLFLDRVRHTPEYAQKFTGIRWKEGMTEGAYIQTYTQYKNLAKQAGVTLTRPAFAKMLNRGVSPQELADRVSAIQSIERWGPMWQYFSDALSQRGFAPPKGLSKKDLADFVMKLGPKQWERVYEETFITAGLERVAGIQVGKDFVPGQTTPYAITRQDLLTLVKQVEGLNPGTEVEKLGSQDYAKIGASLRRYDPSYLQRYDITTRDILELELGGPRAGTIAAKAEKLLATQEAFNEPRAVPQQAQAIGQSGPQNAPQSL